jgi:DNA-binding IclR family transcriptional regulator
MSADGRAADNAESTAAAHTSRLRDQSGHTTNVAVWTEDRPIIVRWDSGTHVLPINVRVGSVLPLLDSAVGLTFLAYLPAAQTAGVLATQQARQETHSRRRRAREAPGQNEARRDREVAAPDDLRDGGVRRPYSAPTGASCSRSASPCRPACWSRAMGEADGLADALRNTAGQISAELGYRSA